MRHKTIGYVVFQNEQPTQLGQPDDFARPVLYYGGRPATMFKTRAAASRLVRRTVAYRKANGRCDGYSIGGFEVVRVGEVAE